jgi:biopolymer transport protein ExbD
MAQRDVPEVNAGSMADIAFLLLIFFLVTTTMDKDTAYIRNIPQPIDVKEPTKVMKRNILAIKSNSNNQLMVRGEIFDNPDKILKIVAKAKSNEEKHMILFNLPEVLRA